MTISRCGEQWFKRQVANGNEEVASYHTYENFLLCRAQQAVLEDGVWKNRSIVLYVENDLHELFHFPRSVASDLIGTIREYAVNHAAN